MGGEAAVEADEEVTVSADLTARNRSAEKHRGEQQPYKGEALHADPRKPAL